MTDQTPFTSETSWGAGQGSVGFVAFAKERVNGQVLGTLLSVPNVAERSLHRCVILAYLWTKGSGNNGSRPIFVHGGTWMGSDIVLYYTHYLSAAIQREIYKIREELGNNYRLAVIAFAASSDLPGEVNGVPVYCYNTEQICQLPYGRKVKSFRSSWLGHVDLAPLMFFRDNPGYARYWIIEHDVRFSGNWRVLFEDLSSSKADLLCTALQTWAQNRNWAHWRSLRAVPTMINRTQLVKGFMPFCRLSYDLLKTIDASYQSGWDGHFEVVWPTSATVANLTMEEIGGHGSFTPVNRKGRYYINNPDHWSLFPGTFVYRPWFSERNRFAPDEWPECLWHPVRE